MKLFLPISLSFLLFSAIETKSLNQNFFKNPPFKDFYGNLDANIKVGDAGDPLILTDFIKSGQVHMAQDKAVVRGLEPEIKSYAGYLKVDETYDSNLFFWFFPSNNNPKLDPVILWLQGGPGSSSMFGLFQENGPFYFIDDNKLAIRNTSWTRNHSVLYIDQPAGTGWSFTNGGYAQNQTKVAADLYEALHQFFSMFYQYQHNEFFITGESYGGKYVPAISYEIHKRNADSHLKINLKGLGIGNGFTHPIVQLRYSDYLYSHGLVDLNTRNELNDIENEAVQAIQLEDYERAFDLWNKDLQIVKIRTRLDVYNYLTLTTSAADDSRLEQFFQQEYVRRAIHVGNTKFNDPNVYSNLAADIPKSEAHSVSKLLNHYRVLIYNGQTDIIVPYPLTVNYLQNLRFSASDDYATAPRGIWYDENNRKVIAGYAKTAGNLTEIMVRNSGHMVPADQPEWALQLINRFTGNKPFF